MPAHLPSGRPVGSLTHDPEVGRAFGQAVVNRRTAIGKSQLKLANESTIERSHMGRIERGENVPNLVAVFKIADALACSAADLVGECQALLRVAQGRR